MDFPGLCLNLTLLACLSSALAVTFATFVIIDFISDASKRYKTRYIQETAVEYDDVLLQMPPGKIFDLSLALAGLGAFLGIALLCVTSSDPSLPKILFVGALVAVFFFFIPRLWLRHLKKQRLNKFNEQLEDALLSISGSLKAGFSLSQALDVVANENRRPISFEFSVLIQELRLGVNFDEAFEKMARRVGSADFELVVIAVITARQTGGELTSVLERLAGVIRERIRITNKLNALTAQGRLQAYIIGAMPFLLLAAMAKIAPDMVDAFFNSPLGLLIMLLVIGLVVTGFLIIRKITTIDV